MFRQTRACYYWSPISCEHYKLQSPPYSFSLHTPNYLYDPITHYIYGLARLSFRQARALFFIQIYFRQSTSSPVGEGFVVYFYNIQSKQLLNYEFTFLVVVLPDSACFVGVVIALRELFPLICHEQKFEAYECGIPTRKSWMQFRVGYYLFAILFHVRCRNSFSVSVGSSDAWHGTTRTY